jgi:cell division protease FtsH
MNKSLQILAFSIAAFLVSAYPANSCSKSQSQGNLSYSDFINKVQSDEINQVRVSADRTYATFNSKKDNSVVRVALPQDPNFIDTMTKNGVDIVFIPAPR